VAASKERQRFTEFLFDYKCKHLFYFIYNSNNAASTEFAKALEEVQ
jgi:hypothetical protein